MSKDKELYLIRRREGIVMKKFMRNIKMQSTVNTFNMLVDAQMPQEDIVDVKIQKRHWDAQQKRLQPHTEQAELTWFTIESPYIKYFIRFRRLLIQLRQWHILKEYEKGIYIYKILATAPYLLLTHLKPLFDSLKKKTLSKKTERRREKIIRLRVKLDRLSRGYQPPFKGRATKYAYRVEQLDELRKGSKNFPYYLFRFRQYAHFRLKKYHRNEYLKYIFSLSYGKNLLRDRLTKRFRFKYTKLQIKKRQQKLAKKKVSVKRYRNKYKPRKNKNIVKKFKYLKTHADVLKFCI